MHQNYFACDFPCEAEIKKRWTEGTELGEKERLSFELISI